MGSGDGGAEKGGRRDSAAACQICRLLGGLGQSLSLSLEGDLGG